MGLWTEHTFRTATALDVAVAARKSIWRCGAIRNAIRASVRDANLFAVVTTKSALSQRDVIGSGDALISPSHFVGCSGG
jgi:hypothetical protein